jgi:hypothetical protein
MADNITDSSTPAKRSQKSLDSVAQFPAVYLNDHHAYCARKAERLATAVHVVTGFIAKDEPVRTVLRAASLELSRLSTDRTRLLEVGAETFSTRCAEISSILVTAESAGLVSQMNAKLIIEEYARLATFVRERYSFIHSHVSDIQDITPVSQTVSDKGQKDIKVYRSKYVEAVKDTSQTSSRRADILALFNHRERISVKDAVQTVPGVSEKTLQRELLAMVADGTLKKEGERRWSTYIRVLPRG